MVFWNSFARSFSVRSRDGCREPQRKTGVDQWLQAASKIAAVEFQRLRKAHPRIGSGDLNIASIALNHNAIVITNNLRDFTPVAGLKVEDWTK